MVTPTSDTRDNVNLKLYMLESQGKTHVHIS